MRKIRSRKANVDEHFKLLRKTWRFLSFMASIPSAWRIYPGGSAFPLPLAREACQFQPGAESLFEPSSLRLSNLSHCPLLLPTRQRNQDQIARQPDPIVRSKNYFHRRAISQGTSDFFLRLRSSRTDYSEQKAVLRIMRKMPISMRQYSDHPFDSELRQF